MKYVINWRERSAASFKDYEAAQERVLRIFNKDWKMSASFTVHQFVIRVGDYGGYMIVETDSPTDIHYFASVFAVFRIQGGTGHRCDGRGGGRGPSHRVPKEERSRGSVRGLPADTAFRQT